MSASGNRRQSASTTLSPPRIPSSRNERWRSALFLPGVCSDKHGGNCPNQDLGVELKRPVTNQEQIQAPALNIAQTAPAADLPQPGKTRPYAKDLLYDGAIVDL